MAASERYAADVRAILARRAQFRGGFWATPDGRIGKGSPFATVDCALLLTELGVKRSDAVMRGTAEALFAAWQEDGRFRVAPGGSIYPCHTATVARALCWMGYARDRRLRRTFEHLLEFQHVDGGWRCNVRKLGRSAITDASNPGVTLAALDAFRFSPHANREKRLDRAAAFLLDHWETRRPLGPCAFGIGSRFMQVEYPFLRYNLFYYVYVLSCYAAARRDRRFAEALTALSSKLDEQGRMVVESPRREHAKFELCRRGAASEPATKRYREILKNVGGNWGGRRQLVRRGAGTM